MAVSRTRPADEETPLLRQLDDDTHERPQEHQQETKETPIPWAQFSLTLFLQFAEPLTSQVIYPFIPQLIREIGITNGDETKVGYYVGMMQSIFFATQALTVLHWSRISDSVGRKPVILVGLFGLSLSMYCFGLSRSFAGLVISRCLSGALNGNIGVVKSMMGELTDSTNVARAFAYQPIPWSLGATIGPLIGGALSRPAERFPDIFGGNEFLKKYPYFLPCAIPASFSIIAWIIMFFFLKETNPTGFKVSSLLRLNVFSGRSRSRSPTLTSKLDLVPAEGPKPTPPLRSLLTPPVILSIVTYALLSLLDIAYRALQPVFYSTPRSLGGLGLEPHSIGGALAILGLANGAFQVCCFARMVKRWGVRITYLAGIASAAPIFIIFPMMSAVVRAEGQAAAGRQFSGDGTADDSQALSLPLLLLLSTQLALTLLLNMSYSCVFIYITAAANTKRTSTKATPKLAPARPPISSSSSSATLVPCPNSSSKRVASPAGPSSPKRSQLQTKKPTKGKRSSTLGAVNGLAQCTVSVMRCVGPYAASSLYAKGLSWQYGSGAYEPPESLPDSPVFEGSVGSLQSGLGATYWEGSDEVFRRLGGMLVYIMMIVIVVFTLVVGAGLPDEPWGADDEEIDDGDGDGEGNTDGEQ
ncbi:hypothetical protein M0805_000016 [Coniferiporia weirii]|nr:hypothetical protein M0805_000016 [Coniferiporia weirii]